MIAFKKHKLIGVTGIIGSGKTFFAHSLLKKHDINIIEIDDVRRDLLWNLSTNLAINLRKEIINTFNLNQYDKNYFFNRETFTQYIFSQQDILTIFNKICFPYFEEEIKNRLSNDKVNLLVWVNLIEDNYWTLVEHIVLVNVSEKIWNERNILNLNEMQLRLKLQSNAEKKLSLINTLNISYEVFQNE